MGTKDIQKKNGKQKSVPFRTEQPSSMRFTFFSSKEALSSLRLDLTNARYEYRMGKYSEAEVILIKLMKDLKLNMTKTIISDELYKVQFSLLYASSCTVWGQTLERLNRGEEAEAAFDQAIALFDLWLHQVDIPSGQDYSDYGIALLMTGQEKKGIDNLLKAVFDFGFTSAETYRYLGINLQEQGYYGKALKFLKKALELIPDDQEIHDSLAALARKLESEDRKPEASSAYQVIASAMASIGRPSKALEIFDKALALNPENAQALGCKVEILHMVGRYDEAFQTLNLFLPLISDDASNAWAMEKKGEFLRLMGRYDEAIQTLEDLVLTQIPIEASVLASKGETLRMMGRYDEALQDLNKALELNPDVAWVLSGKGETLRLIGNFEDALKTLDQAEFLNPDDAFTVCSKGETLRMMGRYNEALIEFDKALEMRLDDDWLLPKKGETLHMIGGYDEALKSLNQALDQNPENALALRTKGRLMSDIGHFKEAVDLLDKVIKHDISDPDVFAVRGWSLENIGKDRALDALQSYEIALKKKPDDIWIEMGIANCQQNLGDLKKAEGTYLSIIKKIKDRDIVDAHTMSIVGWCQYRLGDYDEAVRLFLDALSLNADMISTQFDLALAFMCSGRNNFGLQQYQRSLELVRTKNIMKQQGLIQVALTDIKEALETRTELKNMQEIQKGKELLEGALKQLRGQIN